VQRAAVFTLMLCKMVTIKCGIMYINSKLNYDFDGMVVLQNSMDTLKSEPGPCTGTALMSSDDGNQVVVIKVEEITDIKAEEDPEPTASPIIKTEPAVSCLCVHVCVCVECYSHCTDIQSYLI